MPTFENPIIRGFNPDPTICVVEAHGDEPTTFYLSTSTFDLYPGCAIYSSTDLINWNLIGHALTRRSQIEMRTVEPGAGSWASTLRYRPDEKRFYLANCLFQRYRPGSDERIFPRGFYVWTDNIQDETSWSDPIYFDNPGFDQDLFWDDDGKVYLSTTMRIANRPVNSNLKDFAIHISEIDMTTGNTLSAPEVIRQSPHGIAEGSHLMKRGQYYYLFTAEGGTEAGHQEWVFRSREGPYGPWESQGKPLWYNGPDEEVQRTGHADVFNVPGTDEWWAVLLGVRPVKENGVYLEPQLGRETFLVRVEWKDNWPVFNGGRNISLVTEGSEQTISARHKQNRWQADLTGTSLYRDGWYHKGTPIKQCWTLEDKPGALRLYGNCFDLTSPESPAMLLRRQTAYKQSSHATITFNPSRPGYEAGLVLWWNQYSHATIGVVCHRDEQENVTSKLVIKKPSGQAGIFDQTDIPIFSFGAEKSIELSITACETQYILSATQGHKNFSSALNVADLTVAPPVGGCFTGVMFGLYACGKGEPVLDPADFENIWIDDE